MVLGINLANFEKSWTLLTLTKTLRYVSEIYHKLNLVYILWGSKVWARDLGLGTTFHQQYARGEEITEDRCN